MTERERKRYYDEIQELKRENIQLRYQIYGYERRDRMDPVVREIHRVADALRYLDTSRVVEVAGQKRWVLVLNEYQRSNLLWVFAAMGTLDEKGVEPITYLSTGDWAGEIPNMLTEDGKGWRSSEGIEKANSTLEELRMYIEGWKEHTK